MSQSEPKRAFDVSSLIGEVPSKPSSPIKPTNNLSEKSYPSPNLSVGPPPPPPTHPAVPPAGLYPYLLQSGLYQQLAAAAAARGAGGGIPPLNPMLFNAQLALNPFLASAYAANLAASERLHGSSSSQHRYSPYPPPSSLSATSPRTSSASPNSITGSAFHPITPKNNSTTSPL